MRRAMEKVDNSASNCDDVQCLVTFESVVGYLKYDNTRFIINRKVIEWIFAISSYS